MHRRDAYRRLLHLFSSLALTHPRNLDLHPCNLDLQIGSAYTDFDEVKEALEPNYECMGITCADHHHHQHLSLIHI